MGSFLLENIKFFKCYVAKPKIVKVESLKLTGE